MKTNFQIIISRTVKALIIAAILTVCSDLYGQVQPKSALTVEQCLKLADEKEQTGDIRDAADYLNDAAYKSWDAKDYRNAIQYYSRSKELNERIPNWNGIAGINTNLGLIYFDMNEYEKSYEYLQLAYAYRMKQNDKPSVINALFNLSVTLNKMERYNEAVKALEEAASVARELNDFEKLRSCYGMLSEVYTKSGNAEKAADVFLMYKAIHDDILKDTEKRYKDELSEADLKTRLAERDRELAEREKELAEKERELAESRKRYADDELAEMTKALEGIDAEKQELLLNKTKTELAIEVSESYKREMETQLKQERIKSRILVAGLCVTLFVIIIVVFFLWQRKKDNRRLAQQHSQIVEQRKEIMDSIHYAQHIQRAVMPDPSFIQEIISDHFLFFRPREIVSGDFFWATRIGNKSVIATADCTGHGVPGAFLSMLGISSLNEIVLKLGIETASEILDHLREQVKTTMSRTVGYGEHRDGMDIALCIIDYDKMELQYSGAYISLFLARDGKLEVYPADKMPVGIHTLVDEEKKFANHVIPLQHDDMLYFSTDGYTDQFGGENHAKFKGKPFRKLLTQLSPLPTEQQKNILIQTHEQWKGNGFQVDDILVMGIRIN